MISLVAPSLNWHSFTTGFEGTEINTVALGIRPISPIFEENQFITILDFSMDFFGTFIIYSDCVSELREVVSDGSALTMGSA